MSITPLTVDRIPDLEKLLALGEPNIRLRGSSDYWLYATLFANTCPLAIVDGQVVGSVIAFRSQVDPSEIYLQDDQAGRVRDFRLQGAREAPRRVRAIDRRGACRRAPALNWSPGRSARSCLRLGVWVA